MKIILNEAQIKSLGLNETSVSVKKRRGLSIQQDFNLKLVQILKEKGEIIETIGENVHIINLPEFGKVGYDTEANTLRRKGKIIGDARETIMREFGIKFNDVKNTSLSENVYNEAINESFFKNLKGAAQSVALVSSLWGLNPDSTVAQQVGTEVLELKDVNVTKIIMKNIDKRSVKIKSSRSGRIIMSDTYEIHADISQLAKDKLATKYKPTHKINNVTEELVYDFTKNKNLTSMLRNKWKKEIIVKTYIILQIPEDVQVVFE